MLPPSPKPFCGVCVETITGKVYREPIGRDGGEVNVCEDCATLAVDDEDDSELEVVHNLGPGDDYAARKIAAFTKEPQFKTTRTARRLNKHVNTARQGHEGWLLVRVLCHDENGDARDSNEAKLTLEHEPWFGELVYLDSARGYHLFERPMSAAEKAVAA